MSLADAITRTIDVRDVPTVEVARRMGQDYDRATFYRLATGATTDPRLGTFIVLCRALDVAPTEFLHLAGYWPASDHPDDTLDLHPRPTPARGFRPGAGTTAGGETTRGHSYRHPHRRVGCARGCRNGARPHG